MIATAARLVAYMRPADMAENAESIAVGVSATSALSAGILLQRTQLIHGQLYGNSCGQQARMAANHSCD